VDVDARLEAMAEENQRLRDRVEVLERELGIRGFLPPIEWRLTGSEARVFGVLLARDLATKALCMAALYSDRIEDEVEIKIVDVFICKIRAKLKPFGIGIETRWGEGYFLTSETKAAVRAILGGPELRSEAA
jgi:two-component system cell cycle response regulator CtrA